MAQAAIAPSWATGTRARRRSRRAARRGAADGDELLARQQPLHREGEVAGGEQVVHVREGDQRRVDLRQRVVAGRADAEALRRAHHRDVRRLLRQRPRRGVVEHEHAQVALGALGEDRLDALVEPADVAIPDRDDDGERSHVHPTARAAPAVRAHGRDRTSSVRPEAQARPRVVDRDRRDAAQAGLDERVPARVAREVGLEPGGRLGQAPQTIAPMRAASISAGACRSTSARRVQAASTTSPGGVDASTAPSGSGSSSSLTSAGTSSRSTQTRGLIPSLAASDASGSRPESAISAASH